MAEIQRRVEQVRAEQQRIREEVEKMIQEVLLSMVFFCLV